MDKPNPDRSDRRESLVGPLPPIRIPKPIGEITLINCMTGEVYTVPLYPNQVAKERNVRRT
jgi:hypothetical protein